MVYLLEKLFHNSDLNLELTSYVDDKQMYVSGEKTLL